mmetsp:Transcript_9078/g.22233  ORF Transcript_9078/g.22233 Transcript_9078/m.22233 type:complete len:246 (+) Transcript_9078:554-1291(+)
MGAGIHRQTYEGACPNGRGRGGGAAPGPLLPGTGNHAEENRSLRHVRHLQTLARARTNRARRRRSAVDRKGHLSRGRAAEEAGLLVPGTDRKTLSRSCGSGRRSGDLPANFALPQGRGRVRKKKRRYMRARDRPTHAGFGEAHRQRRWRSGHGGLHHGSARQQPITRYHDAGLRGRLLRNAGARSGRIQGYPPAQGCVDQRAGRPLEGRIRLESGPDRATLTRPRTRAGRGRRPPKAARSVFASG